jgi:DNA invertase Pin-like site-specific DNA recombinase
MSAARVVSAVVGYYRVSTGGQGKSGLGLEAQRDAVHRFVAAEGMTLIAELTEWMRLEHGPRTRRGDADRR